MASRWALVVGSWWAVASAWVPVVPRVASSRLLSSSRSEEAADDDVPPEVAADVRDFRARLISRSMAGGLTSEGATQEPPTTWAYETSLLEQGSVLLGGVSQDVGFALKQQYFHKCVVVLVQHDGEFTKGVIVNRPSRRTLDGWPVWLGGDVSEGGIFGNARSTSFRKRLDVLCLTGLESLGEAEGCRRVVRGVKQTSFENAKKLVAQHKATKHDFWVFVGYAGWAPNQLAGELERQSWFVAAADGTSLVEELLEQRKKALAEPRLDDGVATWEHLMRRIGRDAEASKDTGFDDIMLRAWIEARLSLPRVRESDSRRAAEAATRRLSGPPGEPIARGTLLAGRAVTLDDVLDRQFLHKSLSVVVASSPDIVVAAVLNRATSRTVSLDLGRGRNAQRRIAFGGELTARGAPGGVVWLKLGPLSSKVPGDRLHGPRAEADDEPNPEGATGLRKRRDRRPHLCAPRDVADALDAGDCAVTDLLAICGVTAWQKDDFVNQIGDGALVPIPQHQFPWRDIFDLHGRYETNDQPPSSQAGIAAWRTALHQAGYDDTPAAPPRDARAEAAQLDVDDLADQALQYFQKQYFDVS